MEAEVLILAEELDEELVEAGEDVPVDVAEVVARGVVAEVVELDGIAAALGAAFAREFAGEDLAGEKVEAVEALSEGRGKEVLDRTGEGVVGVEEHAKPKRQMGK